MTKRLAFTCLSIVILSYLFIGCGVRPQVDFYVTPVPTEMEQMKIDEEARSVTMESKDGVYSIVVSSMDAADLLEVTSDAYINPYIYVDDWGSARPRYTVFDVTIKNKSEYPLEIDLTTAVLMDDEGEQYEAITYEEFKERYSRYPGVEREIIYYDRPPRNYYWSRFYRPWYYHYDLYREQRPYYVHRTYYDPSYSRRAVLKGTMLKSVKLYPGGKNHGFLVFPLVAPDAAELKLIFPEVEEERLEFHFQRTPAVK
jgi:hypothetical protein